MKVIGLLSGMSWESTRGYCRAINQGVKHQLGGFHSTKIVIYRVDFAPIEKLQQQGDWDAMAKFLIDAAQKS
ncbi:MAG: aspartate racemase [Lentisphaeria bacterium]|jgi:aspartate racemase